MFFCWKIQDHELHGPYQSKWFFNELVIEKEMIISWVLLIN